MAVGFLPDNHVMLGTSILPINGPVNITQATTTAPKITIGDTTRASNTLADEWTVSDNRAGLLIKYLDEQTNVGRFFWSTIATWTPRRLHLPPLVTTIVTPNGDTTEIDGAWEYEETLYVSYGGKIWTLDNTDDTWSGTFVVNLGATPTDGTVYKGKLYLAIGDGGYWEYDGANWTVYNGTPIQFFAHFDVHPSNKLMAIDSTGLIKASINGIDWTETIGGEVIDSVPTKLLSYRNPVDEPALFVATTTGLIAVDPFTKTNAPTSLSVIGEEHNGVSTLVWNDGNLYYPNGLTLWRYPKTGQINNVGLDRDDGLPTFVRGRITTLTSTPNYLVVGVDVTTVVEDTDVMAPAGEDIFGATAFSSAMEEGPSTLFLYTGSGWHTLYQANDTSRGLAAVHFTASYGGGERRLFFSDGTDLRYLVIPEGNYDPTQDVNARFQASGVYETGWFDSGYEEISKTAASMNFRVGGMSAETVIKVEFAVDESDGFIPMGTITHLNIDSSGHIRFPFYPSADDLVSFPTAMGRRFYSIKFRFTLETTDPTKTPYVIYYNLVYKRMHKTLFAFTFQCSAQDIGELRGMWETVLGYKTSNLIQPFIYRNQDVEDEYAVVVLSVSAMRHAGGGAGGTFSVTCSELEA